MTHGGARTNAGRPRTQLDMHRLKVLLADGFSRVEIASRFGVSWSIVRNAIQRMGKA